jgi:hypothetical protein
MTNKTIPRIGTLLLLAVSAIAFPSLASAGSFLYTVTDTYQKASFSFEETTLASSGTVTSGFFNVTLGDTVNGFTWNSASGGTCSIGGGIDTFGGQACAGDQINSFAPPFFPFAAGSFLSTGTYNSTSGPPEMTVAIQAVPEPSAVAVLGSGLLFVAGGLWRIRRLVAQTAR